MTDIQMETDRQKDPEEQHKELSAATVTQGQAWGRPGKPSFHAFQPLSRLVLKNVHSEFLPWLASRC